MHCINNDLHHHSSMNQQQCVKYTAINLRQVLINYFGGRQLICQYINYWRCITLTIVRRVITI